MRAFPVAVLCALLSIATPTAIAQDSDGTSFVAEPGPDSQTDPEGGYFVLETAPGETVEQSIGLRNDSDEQLTLHLAAVDATTGQLGGASYALADEPATGTAAWITLERAEVTLQPGASDFVSFDVAVPEDARSGQHLAGLSIAAPSEGEDAGEAGEGEAGASIDVQTRRIIAVQVELPGSAEPELVVGGVTAAARPDGLYLEIAIENGGRGLTKAEGVITVGEDFEREFSVDTFVPGTSIAYPIKWPVADPDGQHEAVVELRYGGEIAEWEGSFAVGDETLEELGDRQVASPEPGTSDGQAGGQDLPLVAIVAAVLAGGLLVAGGLWISRVVRSRRAAG